MAISAATMWEIRQDASPGSNSNGGGFSTADPSTAFPTDLTATSATGNSPVVSSATYTFVTGDEDAWVYVKSGTNWTAGFYQIASVAGGAATLRAAIGEAVQYNSTQGRWMANTVAGCATTASPTGGTFAIDYSQQAAAEWNITGVTTAGADAILLTASAAINMVGNCVRIASGTNFTTGWYQILSVVAGVSITLDRTCTSAAGSSGVVNIGGAMSLNSTLDDDFFEAGAAGNTYWVRYNASAIALGEDVSVSLAGTAANPISWEGYNAIRGDRPTGSGRPTINCGIRSLAVGAFTHIKNIIFTTSTSNGLQLAASCFVSFVKATNSSTTATRIGISSNFGNFVVVIACEAISYRGYAMLINGSYVTLFGCFVHDSDVGARITSSAGCMVESTIVSSCVTAAVQFTATNDYMRVNQCTLFGSTNTTGTGVSIAANGRSIKLFDNIITGFVTGVSHADTQAAGFDDYNCYYNNDADVSAATQWQKGPNDVATDPSFTNVGQVTGTTGAFTAGNDRIVDTSKNFTNLGVVANQDHIYIISGTGVTAGIYAITSIATTTNPNDTLLLSPAPGTNTTTDKTYQITTGHNFLPTGSI